MTHRPTGPATAAGRALLSKLRNTNPLQSVTFAADIVANHLPAIETEAAEALREAAVRYLATDGFHGMWDAAEFRRASAELVTLLGGESVILAEGDRIIAGLHELSREPGEEG